MVGDSFLKFKEVKTETQNILKKVNDVGGLMCPFWRHKATINQDHAVVNEMIDQ